MNRCSPSSLKTSPDFFRYRPSLPPEEKPVRVKVCDTGREHRSRSPYCLGWGLESLGWDGYICRLRRDYNSDRRYSLTQRVFVSVILLTPPLVLN